MNKLIKTRLNRSINHHRLKKRGTLTQLRQDFKDLITRAVLQDKEP